MMVSSLRRGVVVLMTAVLSLVPSAWAVAQRQMERLGRGVVAVRQPDGKVWVGWRMLGTDPDGVAFNLYRSTAGARPPR